MEEDTRGEGGLVAKRGGPGASGSRAEGWKAGRNEWAGAGRGRADQREEGLRRGWQEARGGDGRGYWRGPARKGEQRRKEDGRCSKEARSKSGGGQGRGGMGEGGRSRRWK